jgi:tRNA wybutosine-synthesizing protein 2
MAKISNPRETVVDMFAGIGYFTLPMAVHSRPARIYACELNPVAFGYLRKNAKLNGVSGIVQPLFGDCREVAPKGVADRAIMGYLDSMPFLSTAIKVLKDEGGTIHYHEACPANRHDRAAKRVEDAAKASGKKVRILNLKAVKSYAPCIDHVVVDALVAD